LELEITSVVDEGLGHAGHLVAVDGQLLVIDPLRCVDRYLDVARRRDWRLRWTADTHTHADYASGSRELAARGATFFASRSAQLEGRHHALDGGDEVDIAGLTLRALPTPGHTPDHLAYLLLDRSRPVAVFTGGSLMVGAAGRTDLFGPEHTESLARTMWRSIHEQLLVLPEDLAVYPTHGAGSFCAAPAGIERTTTIGREKAFNPLLRAGDEDEFVKLLLGSLGPLPAYFTWLPDRNRVGFGPPPRAPLTELSVEDVERLLREGAEVIDVRPVTAYAHKHVPGSLSNALRPSFSSWLGALVAPDSPLVFVADDSTDRAELVRQCANIGYDRIVGELHGGIRACTEAGRPTRSLAVISVDQLSGPVVDVRLHSEYETGHLPGATHLDLATLADDRHQVPHAKAVMCGHGERAATAASIFERRYNQEVRVVLGGPADWSAATGQALDVGQ
jgi:hydroxyacylglutathione hydrolase